MSINIKLFGTGLRFWVCKIPKNRFEQFKMIAEFNDVELFNVFFDLEILNKIGYSHWSNIFPIINNFYFVLNNRNKIEVKKANQNISSFYSNELIGDETLFNIYNIDFDSMKINFDCDFKYIILGQWEVGVFLYRIESEEFNIDDLYFKLNKGIEGFVTLSGFKLKDESLNLKKSDSLVQSFYYKNLF